jgi:hypothetical protein
MSYLTDRAKEPSTYAGIGLIFQSVATLVATKGMDATAWSVLIPALLAVFRRG